ncbi:dihydrofolate reductase family protein [uncultured Cellulomonas sp.]|uniref:dihydrofolate reductase family protein n=1 Tax=uncultured Cellulomonas sp. TaxID=189682 RepID=UPI0028EA8EF9|nr:dihydrofolate reductase family protein [uncultured Cellulomonas sp.]
MARLVTLAITSLDGYVADADGGFDWAAPAEDLHQYVNDLDRQIGTHLYGRRMYEVMQYWETAGQGADEPAVERDYAAVWQATDKVVYSRTLDAVTTRRTRLERSFEPDAVRALVASADRDVSVGGPGLASVAFRAGLVDEILLFAHPVVVGGGIRALPDGVRADLDLVDERTFSGGVRHARYRVRR